MFEIEYCRWQADCEVDFRLGGGIQAAQIWPRTEVEVEQLLYLGVGTQDYCC